MKVDYYPFGLKHKGYNSQITGRDHQYGYNGIEESNELGNNMFEMDMRQYDPAIARWVVQDPITHHDYSPYQAFDNNPIFFADPSGADGEHYNFSSGQYENGNGEAVSYDEAMASQGLNADGTESSNSAVSDTVEEECCGEAGAERMIRQRMASKMAKNQGLSELDVNNQIMGEDAEAGYQGRKNGG